MSREVVGEARSIIRSAMDRIDKRVLSKSAELKPRLVSIASRIHELLHFIDAILGGLYDKIGEETGAGKTLSFGPFLYVSLYSEAFTLVRSKPYTITLSYRKGEGKVYVRTRNFKAAITPTTLELSKLAMKISIDIGSIDDLSKNLSEVKYLLKSFGRIIEYQLLPVAEKRLGISI
jgi:hypothetical protein